MRFSLEDIHTRLFLLASTVCLFFVYAYLDIGNIPFYLDDFSSIVENPLFKSEIDFSQIWQVFKSRFVTYAAFAVQSTVFGKSAVNFHWFSLFLHFITSVLLFLTIKQLSVALNVKFSQTNIDSRSINFLALITAGIFLLHPQNTQAVVYIAQQAVLWAALFYLLSIYCYLKWRLATKFSYLWIVGCVLAFAFAMLSKQSAATLPLVILLVEGLFFGSLLKRFLIIGVCLFSVALSALFIVENWQFDKVLVLLDKLTRETSQIDRLDYLASQTYIVWHYIGQFFSLMGYRLEYDIQPVSGWEQKHFFALSGHLLLIFLAIALAKRHSLFTFGIVFYYLAHLIESTVFPIRDIIFEHRTYLPNTGLCLASVYVIWSFYQSLSRRCPYRWIKILALVVLACTLSVLSLKTSERIEQWGDYKVFYKNEIEASPQSPRAHGEYASALANSGDCPLAIGHFNHAIALYKFKHESALGIQPEMLMNYIGCLRLLKVFEKAEYWEQDLLKQVHEPVRRGMILSSRGAFYLKQKNYEVAEKALSEAYQLDTNDYAITMNLAISRLNLGDYTSGDELLRKALALKPNDALAKRLSEQLRLQRSK